MRTARDRGLIPDRPVAAIDSTGLDSGHISDYYRDRRPPRRLRRIRWIKVALVAELESSFFLAARVGLGPTGDIPDFQPLITQAHQRAPLHRVLADAGYDSEANLRHALETLRIPQCIIRLNRGNRGRKWPLAPLRRALRRCFPRELYRQRWLIESQISAHKRRLGSILTGRLHCTRFAQAQIRILVHNVALLLCFNAVFNRATRDSGLRELATRDLELGTCDLELRELETRYLKLRDLGTWNLKLETQP